ncbi:MAG: hypothetical protein JNK74_27795 [Candidatus Hydrogenedentes bacterium]|nr:hypothetical protein [Candidatus Hydrogenedentota bacterium]
MNREALKLVATALLLGLGVITTAHCAAYLSSPNPSKTFNVIRATDRELLQRYEHADWPFALAELKRRTPRYTRQELTELAFKVVDAGFWFQPDRQIHTEFFSYSTTFLPLPLANWVQTVGPRRREALAESLTTFVNNQRLRAELGEVVDVAALEYLYNDLKADRYPQLWGPSPRCGFDDRLGPNLMMSIRHILDSGVPGGAEALKRLGVNP